MAMNKRTKAATQSLAFLGVIAASIVLLNILGVFVFGRIDVTKNRLFSLSDGSKRVVQNLEDTLEVNAYFTKDLPPPFNATERYVRDLLDEYAAASGGKVRVRFINPDNDETREAAETEGVQRVAHQKIENDAVQVVEGYRGVVFKYLGERRTIPVIQGTDGLEYEITQTLKQLTGEKIKIGVLGGHEGPTVSDKMNTIRGLLPTYELVDVRATEPIDQSLRALLIVGPETALSEEELRNIDAYVMNGGSLGVFGGTMKVSQEGPDLTAKPADSGINRLLEKWGVKIKNELVADAQCGQMPMRTQLGISIPVAYPPMPVIAFDSEQTAHPVLFRLQQAIMPFVSPLKLTGELKNDKDVKITVLGQTSKQSWSLTGDSINLKPRNPREWAPEALTGPMPIAVAIEGKLPSAFAAEAVSSVDSTVPAGPKGPARAEKPVHVLVLASNSLLRDDFLPPPDRMQGDQLLGFVALPLNAIDWLAQEDELIAIRAKSVEDPVIEVPHTVRLAEQEATAAAKEGDAAGTEKALQKRKEALEDWDAKKARYRLLNITLMPLLFIAFGVIRWQVRKSRRAKMTL